MSSPLSVLRKNRRMPLPGYLDQQGGRKVPFKEDPLKEYKALLSGLSGRSDPVGPHSTATDMTATSGSKVTQKKGHSSHAPPTDFELMSSMMQKLSLLENKVKTQALDIERKEKKITVLEEKVKLLQKSGAEKMRDGEEEKDLVRTCHKLQIQIWEMESFLNDYGMIWVGDNEKRDTAQQEEVGGRVQRQFSLEGGERGSIWQPEASLVGNFHMNFDLVAQSIRELNVLAGEGESFVRATPRGARLAQKACIPLVLYKNGIFMFDGPFRSYQEPSTQHCIRDLMDGYFPSELKERFPEGVPFQVLDRREEEFKERRPWAEFPGKGQAVVGPSSSPDHTHTTLSQIPGRKLSMDQFLNRLPKVVVKAGRVIDIRDSVKTSLQGSSDAADDSAVTLIDTPVLRDMKERMKLQEGDRPPSARDVATLRLRSEDGERAFILKMRFSETIGHLRRYLDNHRGAGLPGYDIISAFPQRCYGEDCQTLQSCGLTPSAALLLRTRPCPQ
ncbi:UBX domain-containing protein 11 isoform X2 [Osmerus eperlanus]|uniref:UBX domain-containing protein 11 isoform X2 n=1 Tax=Osmerus eperlanus TaxID=29151 RepID=UPI002E0D25E6